MAVLRIQHPTGDTATEALEALEFAGHTIVSAVTVADSFVIIYKSRVERVQRTPKREVR